MSKSNLPLTDYVINPFSGCAHACGYCYHSKPVAGKRGEGMARETAIKLSVEGLAFTAAPPPMRLSMGELNEDERHHQAD